MPACSWVWITTRVASMTACSDGSAPSQSGNGYDPTTVVLMRAGVIRRILPTVSALRVTNPAASYRAPRRQIQSDGMLAAVLPDRFHDVAHLEDVMTAPHREIDRAERQRAFRHSG